MSNEFRVNYSSSTVANGESLDSFGGAAPLDLAGLVGGLGSRSSTTFYLLLGGDFIQLSQGRDLGNIDQVNLTDGLSLSIGRHSLKFGVDYRRLTSSANSATPELAYAFLGAPSVMNNSAVSTIEVVAGGYPLYQNVSSYVQDEWQVSRRLNVSLGLRWDINPPPTVTQGIMPYTVDFVSPDPNTWILAPQGTPLWHTTWHNLAPRLGAAYTARTTPGWETVVRGGGGVFFDTGQQLGSQGFQGPGFTATNRFDFANPQPFPSHVAIPNIVIPPTSANQVYGYLSHLQLPYSLEWNASIEQGLGGAQALTVSYVASHSAKLQQTNQFQPTSNSLTSTFYVIRNGLTSDYDSMQAQFQRKLMRGFTTLASYTWSHCLDYGSVNFNIGYQHGNCGFDVRHNLSAAFSYDVPTAGHNRPVSAILHHWGIDDRLTARTALPVDLGGNAVFDPVTGNQISSGLDIVQGQPIYLYGANCASILQGLGDLPSGFGCPGGRAINPCAFYPVGGPPNGGCPMPANPAALPLASRNFARGFDAVQMDLAVRREFPIYENLRLQFRAEAFNVFNHPNFGEISTCCSNFGQATNTLAQSLGILSPLYQTGGPRSMQFALKFVF